MEVNGHGRILAGEACWHLVVRPVVPFGLNGGAGVGCGVVVGVVAVVVLLLMVVVVVGVEVVLVSVLAACTRARRASQTRDTSGGGTTYTVET